MYLSLPITYAFRKFSLVLKFVMSLSLFILYIRLCKLEHNLPISLSHVRVELNMIPNIFIVHEGLITYLSTLI